MGDINGLTGEVFWKMYQEHCAQGRHHESQRSTVASAVMAVSAAIIGIVTFDRTIAAPTDLPLAFLLIVLGGFGAGFAMKHYERFSLHMERARRYRNALDALLPDQPLRRLKQEADESHEEKFPRMHRWRLHYWWLTVNLVVTLVGMTLFVIAIWSPITPAP